MSSADTKGKGRAIDRPHSRPARDPIAQLRAAQAGSQTQQVIRELAGRYAEAHGVSLREALMAVGVEGPAEAARARRRHGVSRFG